MKLHDLRPAPGSKTARTRVGRGIAAGKGKTAGRGTKGQKARAGGSIPPWFEGGQTPLHMRIPKLRGFKNRFKVEYEVVNVGAIAQRYEAGAFTEGDGAPKAKKGEQLTINADILRAVGLVRDVRKPLKVLGGGELSAALFVVADAFTKSATQKIEAAGGAVSVLEVPTESKPAIGVGEDGAKPAREARTAAGRAAADRKVEDRAARADAAEREAEAAATSEAKAARAPKEKAAKAPKEAKASAVAEPEISDEADSASAAESVADADVDADALDDSDTGASPLEPADGTTDSDAPASDLAAESDAPDDGETA